MSGTIAAFGGVFHPRKPTRLRYEPTGEPDVYMESVSTVGRILSRAVAVGHVPRASVCEGRLRPRRRRKFNGWAQRWQYGARPRRPGQLVQIDHMTFSRDGQAIKEVPADSSGGCLAPVPEVVNQYSELTPSRLRRYGAPASAMRAGHGAVW